jgi:hypothetical protein
VKTAGGMDAAVITQSLKGIGGVFSLKKLQG